MGGLKPRIDFITGIGIDLWQELISVRVLGLIYDKNLDMNGRTKSRIDFFTGIGIDLWQELISVRIDLLQELRYEWED